MKAGEVDADELWQVAWTYIKTVVDTLREPFLILNENLEVISANKTFYAFFQALPEETEGKRVYDLGNGQWSAPKLRILLEDILPKNTFFEDFKVEYDFPKIGHRIMILNARRIYTQGNEKPIMLLAMEDQRLIRGNRLIRRGKQGGVRQVGGAIPKDSNWTLGQEMREFFGETPGHSEE